MFPASRIFAPFALSPPLPTPLIPHTLRLRRRARTGTAGAPTGGGSVAGLGPARGPSPGSTDPASPSPPSPGPSRPGGAVAGLGPARGPSPGSYRPCIAVASVAGPLPARWRCRRARTGTEGAPTCGGSVSGLIPGPPVPATLLHVRTAPTPVGKVTTLLHVRTAPTPVGKVTPRIPHTPGRKPAQCFHSQV